MTFNNIKLLFYLIGIAASFVFISCKTDNKSNAKTQILISEPFLNRLDTSNVEDHDSNCVGFIQYQFQPKIVDASFFDLERIPLLNKITGLKWNPFVTTDSVINFLHIFSSDNDTNRVTYVAEMIVSDLAEERLLSIGSDDGFKAWVNGDSVACTHKGRQLLPNDDIIKVKLKKGRNVILYKVDQGTGDWALYRKFITTDQLNNILANNVSEMYSDILESCILPDSASGFLVNQKNGRSLDTLHTIQFNWKGFDNTKTYYCVNYMPIDIPRIISFPPRFNGKAIFEIKVMDKNGDVVFKEALPVMYEREALRLAHAFMKEEKHSTDPIYAARREALIALFNPQNNVKYSTRLKAHALLDLCQYISGRKKFNLYYQVPQVWAYRSKVDDSVQPFRILYRISYRILKTYDRFTRLFF